MVGNITRLEILFENHQVHKCKVNSLPERYKPTLASNYIDRVSDFWKQSVSKLTLSYVPSKFIEVVRILPGQKLKVFTANFFMPASSTQTAHLFMGMDLSFDRYLPSYIESQCREIAKCSPPSKTAPTGSNGNESQSHLPYDQEHHFERTPLTQESPEVETSVVLHLELEGPHTYYFLCSECKVVLNGLMTANSKPSDSFRKD